jgi:hypothetical protein
MPNRRASGLRASNSARTSNSALLRSHARRISVGKESLTSGLDFTTNALFADDDEDAVTLFLILFGGRIAVVLAATESIIGASPDNNNNLSLDKVQTFPLKKGSLDTNFT